MTRGNAKQFSLELKKVTKYPWIFFQCQKMSAKSVREVLVNADLKSVDQMVTQFEKENPIGSEDSKSEKSEKSEENEKNENSENK